MSIRAKITQRSFALTRPFVTAGWTVVARDVMYLSITDESGRRTGIGEAAPLEAFGTESHDRALEALQQLVLALDFVPQSPEAVTACLDAFPELTSAPCARFAAETALLDLLARREGLPLYRLLGGSECGGFPVNAVIGSGSEEHARAEAVEAKNEGFSCLKLKVGVASLDEDARRVAAIREAAGGDMLIRLDANGAWDRARARDAVHLFAPLQIEYIEQPVPKEDLDGLREIAFQSPVPVAADESLRDLRTASAIISEDIADVYILKPMALGSLIACRSLAETAIGRWKGVVVTSLLDSAVGRCAAAHLVASLPALHTRHHGLGTGRLFFEDLAREPVIRGRWFISDDPGLGNGIHL